MAGINGWRVLLGGVVAGAAIWLLESAASFLYLGKMQNALLAHDIMLEPSVALTVQSVLIALLTGLTMLFFYAAARPRFGPGPKTALLVAVVIWLGGYVPSLISYQMIGIYPRSLLYQWGLVGLLEMIIACNIGAWLYREA
jgi:hypothetical protein